MATQETFHLTISRVDQILFQGTAKSVHVPGTEGEMTVLAHHFPFISTLKKGPVIVTDPEGSEQVFDITSGILEVSHNQATVLV